MTTKGGRIPFQEGNSNVIKIRAFAARIDKTKARKRFLEAKEETLSVEFSPYFPRNKDVQQKPLVCSLSEREAEEYCYKLEKYGQEKEKTIYGDGNRGGDRSSKRLSKLLLFEPSSMERSLAMKEPNVLCTSAVAMANSCKNYPNLASREILNKYAHLFGLKAIR